MLERGTDTTNMLEGSRWRIADSKQSLWQHTYQPKLSEQASPKRITLHVVFWRGGAFFALCGLICQPYWLHGFVIPLQTNVI